MKKTRHTLMQMARYARDRTAHDIRVLEDKIQTLHAEIQESQNAWLLELDLMRDMCIFNINFQGFYKRFQTNQELMHTQLDHLEKDLHQKQKILLDHFEEEKKYEKIDQDQKNGERQSQEHKQRQILDEWSQNKKKYNKKLLY